MFATRVTWSIASVGVMLGAASAGGEEPLVTDRPDFTESGVVVPRGDLQLDLHAAAGLNDEAPDWSVGAGLSTRF